MGKTKPTTGGSAEVPRWSGEGGFTIVESIVGLVIFVLLFVTAATTMQLSIRNQRDVRARQQAVAIATQALEDARGLMWTEVELTTAPAPDGVRTDGSLVYASAFNLPNGDEQLVVDPGTYTAEDPDPGQIDPFVAGAEVVDAQSFDVRRFVTDAGTDLRRVIVVIEWTTYRTAHSYVASTQVAEVAQ
jgi:type II secretory pathway pseudopilin PulG